MVEARLVCVADANLITQACQQEAQLLQEQQQADQSPVCKSNNPGGKNQYSTITRKAPATEATATLPHKRPKTTTNSNPNKANELDSVTKTLDMGGGLIEPYLRDAEIERLKASLSRTRVGMWADSILRNEHLGKVIQASKDKQYFAVSMHRTLLDAGLCHNKTHASQIVAQAMHKTGRMGKGPESKDVKCKVDLNQRTFSAKTIRDWVDQWEESSKGVLPGRKQHLGNTSRWLLYSNPALQEKAIEWVRAHAKRRGKPNMKIKYVNTYLIEIFRMANILVTL